MRNLRTIHYSPLFPLYLILLILLLSGCNAIRRYETRKIYQRQNFPPMARSHGRYTESTNLNDESLSKVPFRARCRCEDITVIYQDGMRPIALPFAANFSLLLKEVEEELGIQIPFKVDVYLVYVESGFSGIKFDFGEKPGYPRFVMMVPKSGSSLEGMILANVLYPYTMIHELVEPSLMCRPPDEDPVTFDIPANFPLRPYPIYNHTRWFREGVASYAGLNAYRKVRNQIAPHRQELDPGLWNRFNLLSGHDRPFSGLAIVRERVFDWINGPEGRYSDEYEQQCYNASLGIFLYLEHRFGQGSVKRIVQNLKGNGCLDREKLIEIINSTLGTDLRALLRDFKFPDDGMKLAWMTPAGFPLIPTADRYGLQVEEIKSDSPGAAWGVQKGDILIAMQGKPVRNHLDYEMAKLDLVEKGKGTLQVVRKEKIHELKTWIK